MIDGRKQLALAVKAASNGVPDDTDLAAIRGFVLRDFKAEELYVRTVVLAHNAIDRDGEVFDEPVLDSFAKTLPGKGLFESHPTQWNSDGGMPEGAWFAASVERMSIDDARKLLREPSLNWPPDRTEAKLLIAKFYVPVMAANEALRGKVDAGLGSVSIGFRAEKYEPIKDRDGREIRARRITGQAEALEGSLVWLGAQPGARVVKNHDPSRGTSMNIEQQLEAAKTAQAAAEAKAATLQAKVDKYEAARTALGDHAVLLDSPSQLAAQLADAKAYRDSLVDDIVSAHRAAGVVKADDEAGVKAAKEAYSAVSTAHLKTLRDAALAGKGAAPSVAGSDPNAPKPGSESGAGGTKTPAGFAGITGAK